MKKSKQAHYDKYFGRNWNKINKWIGIKYPLSVQKL